MSEKESTRNISFLLPEWIVITASDGQALLSYKKSMSGMVADVFDELARAARRAAER